MDAMTASTRRYRGASAEQRRAERRRGLVEAAIAVYGEIGFRRASVRAVCERAGLTERYFYESFPNSEALLIAAYAAVNRALIDELERVVRTTPGSEAARQDAGLAAYFGALRDAPASARVFLVELSGVGPEVERAEDEALELFARLMLDLVDPGGLRRRDEHALLASGVVGAISRIALRWVASGFATEIELIVGVASRISRILVEALPPPDGARAPGG